MNFPNDVWMSEVHSIVEDQGGFLMLTDLGTRGGTFVRIKSGVRLITGDELLIGRTRLRVELLFLTIRAQGTTRKLHTQCTRRQNV